MGATYAFEDPGSTTKLDFAELEGKLVLIQADRVEASIRTVHGPKDATVATLHVVDGKSSEVFHDTFIWPTVVQSQLKQTIGTGKFVLGRVEQGNAKPGQNAPWRLATPTDKDRAMASKYLDGLTDERFAAADDDTPPWEKDPKRAVAAACPPF